jgi:ATP-binding cassette subfamily B protein/subfamily B ATP-binding cassette protein MsbA
MTSAVHAVVPARDARSKPDRSLLRLGAWLLRYAAGRWLALAAVVATMLAKIGLDVLKPWPMKVLVDHALGDRPLPPALATVAAALPGELTREALVTWSVAGTVVLFVLGWALGLATTWAGIAFGQRLVYDLAGDLFAHLQRLSLRFHSRRSIGDSIRRVTTDCGCVSVIVKDALLPLVTSIVSLVVMFGVMWRLEPRLTLMSLAVVPWMVLVLRRYMTPMVERSYEQQQAEAAVYDVVEQTLSAIPVVQAFGREAANDARFERCTAQVVTTSLASAAVGLKFRIAMAVATTLGTAAIIWYGAHAALDGRLTVGGILVFLTYLGSLYGPLESVMYTPSTAQGAAGSAARVLEVLDTDRDVVEVPAARPLPSAEGHVRLEGVTFGYDEGRPVLHDVSLDAAPGRTLAIVGPTGAGKSTLVSLVPRFHDPWTGRVTIDGCDVRSATLRSVRSQVAVVLQDAFLFPLTIAENIAYGRPDAARDAVEAAARAANAHEFIARLPEGYDTRVGERGATLSGGERQRIAIARALLKDAPVLILDEPTSAVDAETEHLLLQALERLMANRTTFIIAHRLSTVRRADEIVFLEDGRVAQRGSPAELLAAGGRFAELWRLQFEGAGR